MNDATAFWIQVGWQTTLCLGVGLLAARCHGARPARAHWVLLLAGAASLLLPLAFRVVEARHWGILVASSTPIPALSPSLPIAADASTEDRRRSEPFARLPGPAMDAFRAPASGVRGARGATKRTDRANGGGEAAAGRVASGGQRWLLLAWAGLSVLVVGRYVAGFGRGYRWVTTANPIRYRALYRASAAAAARLKLSRSPLLVRSHHVRSPVIWCWGRRPVILLPHAIDFRRRTDWTSVFCHELAHARRRDHWAALLATVVVAAYPWHPLAWWCRRRLVNLSEHACDDWVVSEGCSAIDYAESLLDLAPHRGPRAALAAVTRGDRLHARIGRILARDARRPRVERGWSLAAVTVTTTAVVVAALAQPGSASAPANSTGPSASANARPAEDATPRHAGSDPSPGAGAIGKPDDQSTVLPGLVPRPADDAGLGRWQLMTTALRGFVNAVAWSPDGRSIAIGDAGNIRVCNARTLDVQQVLVGHRGRITCVSWDPTGRWMASGGTDGTVRLWSGDGTSLMRLSADRSSVHDVAWSPDGQYVASGGSDHIVRIWDRTGALRRTLTGHKAAVNSVTWGPDGRRLASGGDDRAVRIWNEDGTPGPVLSGHLGPVQSVAWRPDGRTIASAGRGVEIPGVEGSVVAVRLWDADGTEVQEVFGHEQDVLHVEWDAAGDRFVTVSVDRSIRIWNSEGEPISVIPDTKRNQLRVATWSPDGKQLAIGGRYEVRLVSADDLSDGPRLGGETYLQFSEIAWSPDSRRLASVNRDGRVRLWQADGSDVTTLPRQSGGGTALAWSPAGNWLTTGAYSARIQFWHPDGRTGPQVRQHRGFIESLAWNPTGTRLASTSRDGTVRLWDDSGTELRVLRNHQSPVFSASWRADGQRLATGDQQGTIRIWRPPDSLIQTLPSRDSDVDALAWSPDGQLLAAGHQGLIRLWEPDPDDDRRLRGGTTIRGHTDSVMAIAWSPDGQTLLSGGWDTTVRLWTVDGNPRATLAGHIAPVLTVDWSPDGTRIASAGYDRTLQVRDASTGDTQWLAVVMDNGQTATFDAQGTLIDGDPDAVEDQFMYVVQAPGGPAEVLRPSQYRARRAGN